LRSLTLETLEELGGAQEIVRTHLDSSLGNFSQVERYAVADLFHQLVTPSGTKIAHSAADLAEYVDLSEADVTQLLEKLARPDTRIVRAVPPPPGDLGPSRYEIFHDVLAPSILDWRSRQTAAKRAEEQRRMARAAVRRRLLRLGGILGAAAFALIVVLAIAANSQRNQARHQAALARMEADRAKRLELLANDSAATLRQLAQRNRGLFYLAEHNATHSRDLEVAATKQAGRERFLAGEAATQADRSRLLAAQATTLEMRANGLAVKSNEQARVAGSLAAQKGVLAMEAARFDPKYLGHTRYLENQDSVLVRALSLTAPGGATINVSCVPAPRCTLATRTLVGSGTQTIPLRNVAGRELRLGTKIIIFVRSTDIALTFTLEATNPAGLAELERERCRPAGSQIPASDLPACPVFKSSGQATSRTIQLLRASAHGKFTIHGRSGVGGCAGDARSARAGGGGAATVCG
jgi:hypothetical protein